MEFKKKTIIWEPNTEPPKNYYWIKEDNKVYEFSVEERKWVESEEISYTPKDEEETPVEPVDPDTPVDPTDPDQPVNPDEPTDPDEPVEPEFTPVEYTFISYGDAEGEREYARGKVETTEDKKEFDSVEYTGVKVTENSIEGFVGQTFYIVSDAVAGTIYQLYNAEGEAQEIWIKFEEPLQAE